MAEKKERKGIFSSDSGFASSPEFAGQLASQVQDIFARDRGNRLAQTGLATQGFAPMGAQQLIKSGQAGLGGEGFDIVGGTLKTKALFEKRERDKEEAQNKKLVQERDREVSDLRRQLELKQLREGLAKKPEQLSIAESVKSGLKKKIQTQLDKRVGSIADLRILDEGL